MQRSDQRDARTWVVVELSPRGEDKLTEGVIEDMLRSDLGVGPDHGVFVPAVTYTKGDKRVTAHLIEGYVFVAAGLPDSAYFALERHSYISQVMSCDEAGMGIRCPSVISDDEIKALRKQLQGLVALDISEGSWVKVTEGRFHNLVGVVDGVDGDHAYVAIKLRSMEFIASIPLIFLDLLDEEEIPEEPIATATAYESVQPLPPPSVFRDTLISVLGRLSSYDAYRSVPCREVLDLVLHEEGAIGDLPYGWTREGADSLYRRVEDMFAYMVGEYTSRDPMDPNKWRLTESGVVEAQSLNRRASAGDFWDPLLVVLGRLSAYQAFHFVSRDVVIPEVLNEVGLDPENLPRGWVREGRHGVDRRIGWAFRDLRVRPGKPFAAQGPKRGLWGLTKDGVSQSRRLVREGFNCTLIPRLI